MSPSHKEEEGEEVKWKQCNVEEMIRTFAFVKIATWDFVWKSDKHILKLGTCDFEWNGKSKSKSKNILTSIDSCQNTKIVKAHSFLKLGTWDFAWK